MLINEAEEHTTEKQEITEHYSEYIIIRRAGTAPPTEHRIDELVGGILGQRNALYTKVTGTRFIWGHESMRAEMLSKINK